MREKAKEILHTAGLRMIIDDNPEPQGFASHESGTARRGNDRAPQF
jgi:hypothetical protein